jgi:hypothetical protein
MNNMSENIFRRFVYFGLSMLTFATLVSFMSTDSWLFSLLSQFRIQYTAAALCLVIMAYMAQAQRLAWMVGLILLGINAAPLALQMGTPQEKPLFASGSVNTATLPILAHNPVIE